MGNVPLCVSRQVDSVVLGEDFILVPGPTMRYGSKSPDVHARRLSEEGRGEEGGVCSNMILGLELLPDSVSCNHEQVL